MADLISLGGNDHIHQQATSWVDSEHRREQQSWKITHRQAERSMLNHSLSRISSLKQNRAGIDDRYLARIASIGERKERAAERIQAQHKSVRGKIQALTKKGREAQAMEIWRLNGRARQLELRAGKNHQMHLARHDCIVMRARYEEAQFNKIHRIDNRQLRQDYHRYNIENRPNQIYERARELRHEQKLTLSVELKHEMNKQAHQPPSKTVQHNRMRDDFKRDFNQKANPLQHQFNQQVRKR